ncbi:MAG: hypothetical protein FWD69_01020 [Polyangiaceae bacterium]|nr:hypothetical protein [Polyangiaceae bacterium]
MTTQVTPQSSSALEAPAGDTTVRSVRSRIEWLGLAALGIVAVLVFWVFDALPFQDLPAHAGLIAMRHRYAESSFEQRFYVLAPHVGPYSLFRFLGEVFVRVVGPLGAVRALATLPVIATPLALLFARRRLYEDHSPAFGFIGLTLSFSLMTLLGFASYLLGVAVMLVGLTLWLELLVAADDGAPNLRRREFVMAVFTPFIFVAHGHAFVLFLVCAGVACLAAGNVRERLMRLWVLAPAVGLAAWVAWIERGTTTPPGSLPVVPRLAPLFHSFTEKLGLLVTPTLMTRSGIDFLISIFIWIFTIVSTVFTVRSLRTPARIKNGVQREYSRDRFQVDASSRRGGMRPDSNCTESTKWTEYSESDGAKRSEQPASALVRVLDGTRTRRRTAPSEAVPQPPTTKSRQIESGLAADVRHSRALYASAAVLLLAFLALPHAVGWFGFVDGRLVPLVLILPLLGIRRATLPRALVRLLDTGAPVCAATIALLAMIASYKFQAEASGFHEVLAHVPARASLLNLPLDPNSEIFTAHPFVHYDKLTLAERPVVVSDIWFHQGSALYPTPENPAVRLPSSYSESDLKEIDWPAYHLDDWDFVLIRTKPSAGQPSTPNSLVLEEHRGGWWLFRQAAPTQ